MRKKNSLLSEFESHPGTEKGSVCRTPDDTGAILEDESQAEGKQQAVEWIASVDPADEQAFDQQAENCGQNGCDRKRAPEAEIGREREGEIGPDRQEAAMGEIDDARQIENERKAERHQRIERANDEAIEDVVENELRHRACRAPRVGERPLALAQAGKVR